MEYVGFLLRRERLLRNWSQEGLCKGICTVSYLSKIELGKAEPSAEIVRLLMARMELPWYEKDEQTETFIASAYDALLSCDPDFASLMDGADRERLIYSPFGADFLLLAQFREKDRPPLDAELEDCLEPKQLAFQRLLQGRYHEAVQFYPRALFMVEAGAHDYRKGELTTALETLQAAYQTASQEGAPRIMLQCKLMMGNCYSNLYDLAAMETHYAVARRLAKALNDRDSLASMEYNIAATNLETGHYEKALGYFQELADPNRMDLHKLSICYEKMGRTKEAMAALERAQDAAASVWMPSGLEELILRVVRMRLGNPAYLKNVEYGETLLHCFDRCREELPSGYAVFHLPWVLEWYEANRQYKQALRLMQHFPGLAR